METRLRMRWAHSARLKSNQVQKKEPSDRSGRPGGDKKGKGRTKKKRKKKREKKEKNAGCVKMVQGKARRLCRVCEKTGGQTARDPLRSAQVQQKGRHRSRKSRQNCFPKRTQSAVRAVKTPRPTTRDIISVERGAPGNSYSIKKSLQASKTRRERNGEKAQTCAESAKEMARIRFEDFVWGNMRFAE